MNLERSVLMGFFGNYLVNTVIASIVALIPAPAGGGILTPRYMLFVVLAVVVVAVLAWWYMNGAPRNLKSGIVFGVIGFVVAILTALITGVAGVLAQTGSFSAVASVLPNFVPFIWNWPTLIPLGYWIVPAALIGWYLQLKATPTPSKDMKISTIHKKKVDYWVVPVALIRWYLQLKATPTPSKDMKMSTRHKKKAGI